MDISIQYIEAKKIIELFVLKIAEYDEFIKSLKEEYNDVL